MTETKIKYISLRELSDAIRENWPLNNQYHE